MKTPGHVSTIKRFPFGRGGFPEVRLTETSTGLSSPPGEASADPLDYKRVPIACESVGHERGEASVCVNKGASEDGTGEKQAPCTHEKVEEYPQDTL